MAKLDVFTATAPAHWASYFINGDASGMEEDEQKAADAFLARLDIGTPVSCSDEPEFMRYHDAALEMPLAADCLEYTWLVPAPARFRDLEIGQTFDFIDPRPIGRFRNSFFRPCVKVSARKYRTTGGGPIEHFRVGSINAEVFHVGEHAD